MPLRGQHAHFRLAYVSASDVTNHGKNCRGVLKPSFELADGVQSSVQGSMLQQSVAPEIISHRNALAVITITVSLGVDLARNHLER